MVFRDRKKEKKFTKCSKIFIGLSNLSDSVISKKGNYYLYIVFDINEENKQYCEQS